MACPCLYWVFRILSPVVWYFGPLVDAPRSAGSGGSGIALFERSETEGRSNQGRLFFCLLFFWRSKRKVSCRRATPGQQLSEKGMPPDHLKPKPKKPLSYAHA
jgi:hypothetical protein